MARTLSQDRGYCVIGGGPSGLGIGKCLRAHGIPFEIAERESGFGGVWKFESPSSRVYENTHLISSRLNTQFSDFPMPESWPAYPSHRLFLGYLESFSRQFSLEENTLFNRSVQRLRPIDDRWDVTFDDGETRRYRGVFIANGLQREPVCPRYPGTFRGETLHSVEYRSADIFRHKRVLVIGGGNSGCDIAVDAARTADVVYHSTRRPYYYMPKFIEGQPTQEWLMELPMRLNGHGNFWEHVARTLKIAGCDPGDYGLPRPEYGIDQAHPVLNTMYLHQIGHGDIIAKPDVATLDGLTVEFTPPVPSESGYAVSAEAIEADVIVYATGYRPRFSFLSEEYLSWKGARPDLFLYTFHRHFDNLFFMGMVNAAAGFGNVINAAGHLLATYINARHRDSEAFRVFRRLASGPDPELGQNQFIASPRHEFEVDLWKFIKTLNFFRSRLECFR